mgnify:CR=1 FL=1
MLRNMLKATRWLVLGGLVLALMLWGASRWLWPVPEAETQALRRLQAVPAADTHDGFALLWTLSYDGPDAGERQAILARDVRAFAASPAKWQASAGRAGAPVQASSGACQGKDRGRGCLAAVRADPQAVAAAHAGHDGLHARVAQVAQAHDFSSPFASGEGPQGDVLPPLPALRGLFDPVPAHALAHVRGDSAQALAGLCSGIASGRRLMLGGDTLATALVGAALVEVNARVLADVLVELPAGVAVPPGCTTALQPLHDDERSLCRAMQGEFAMGSAVIAHSAAQQPWNALLLDVERTRLRMAPHYGWACDPAVAAARREGRPVGLPTLPGDGWGDKDFSCVANPIGCVLADVAAPAMQRYLQRTDRAAAMLQLVNAQRWLRQQPAPMEAALERLPAALQGTPGRLSLQVGQGQPHLHVAEEAAASQGDPLGPLAVPLQAPPAAY